VENNKIKNIDVFIYPNPFSDIIQIEYSESANIEIINIQGQIIENLITKDTKTTIDLTKLSSGVYIIKAQTDKGVTIKKILKQ